MCPQHPPGEDSREGVISLVVPTHPPGDGEQSHGAVPREQAFRCRRISCARVRRSGGVLDQHGPTFVELTESGDTSQNPVGQPAALREGSLCPPLARVLSLMSRPCVKIAASLLAAEAGLAPERSDLVPASAGSTSTAQKTAAEEGPLHERVELAASWPGQPDVPRPQSNRGKEHEAAFLLGPARDRSPSPSTTNAPEPPPRSDSLS